MYLERRLSIQMTPQLMIQPSSLMTSGVRMREFGGIYLFRFTDELQKRSETLLDKKKENQLSLEESAEYAGIVELQRIFTHINAQLVAQKNDFSVQPDPSLSNSSGYALSAQLPDYRNLPADTAQKLRERVANYSGPIGLSLPDSAFNRETIYGD